MENVCSCIPIYDQSNNNSQSSFHHFDNLWFNKLDFRQNFHYITTSLRRKVNNRFQISSFKKLHLS
jgi:hypothetical protein